MLNPKQQAVIDSVKAENPKILICAGAKRAGKTYVLIWVFLGLVAKFKNKGLSFIIGGATQGSIRRNVLNEIEIILDREIKLDRSNSFDLFGNRVYCFEGTNSDAWKKARGFTAAGAFLNEGTALNEMFVREVESRCSYPGARVYIDTNPENPAHFIKSDYIDNDGQLLDSGQVNIRAFHFSLFDNSALDAEYVDSIVKSTPSGMFYDRDVLGLWVSPAGVVYPDFAKDCYISEDEISKLNFVRYYGGVDWGYEHFGAVVLCGDTDTGDTVVLRIYAHQHQDIDFWIDIGLSLKQEFGAVPFYCDSARPEYVAKFNQAGLRGINARKAIIPGIEQVAKKYKQRRLRIIKGNERFEKEIYQYVWNENTGEPVKLWDDVQDAIRYAIYSDMEMR